MNSVLEAIIWSCNHAIEIAGLLFILAASVWLGYALTQKKTIWVQILAAIGCFVVILSFAYAFSIGIDFITLKHEE